MLDWFILFVFFRNVLSIRNTHDWLVMWLTDVMHLSSFVGASSLRLVWCVGTKSHLKFIPFSVSTDQSKQAGQCDSGVGRLSVRKLYGNFV